MEAEKKGKSLQVVCKGDETGELEAENEDCLPNNLFFSYESCFWYQAKSSA